MDNLPFRRMHDAFEQRQTGGFEWYYTQKLHACLLGRFFPALFPSRTTRTVFTSTFDSAFFGPHA